MVSDRTFVFKSDSQKLIKLNKISFKNEKTLQILIEKNLNTAFEDLEFLQTEYKISNLKADSIAYDKSTKSFVIIEYKNVRNNRILDQGGVYYSLLKKNKADLVLKYNLIKKERRDVNDFDWDSVYVIYLSTKFTEEQTLATDIGVHMKLYEVHQYSEITTKKDNQHAVNIIMLERIGDTSKDTVKPNRNKLIKKTKKHTASTEYDETEYLNEGYGRVSSPKTKELYIKIQNRILEQFSDLESKQNMTYMKFYHPENNAIICTQAVFKSKINLVYSIKTEKNILSKSNFIQVNTRGKTGNGDYQSEINNEDDIEKAMHYVEKVYNSKIQG